MNAKPQLRFENFRLDGQNQELRCDSRLISLRPKTFAVLLYLAENPGRLITQEELLKAVWGPVAVGDGLLRGYVREIRHALGDDAARPRFLETVPRRGLRFLAEVSAEAPLERGPEPLLPSFATPTHLVERDEDLQNLRRFFASSAKGKRQVILIPGESGIGKTALLNAFLDSVRDANAALIASGQCVEQYGTGEAYLPIFDAMGRLCHGEHANDALAVLSLYAPSWLAQMPGFVSEEQFQTLQNRAQGTMQPRMLREFCEAMEILALSRPLIIALEDLQWSDLSTLNLLSVLARREESARLMVIGTYRPADLILSNHPLRTVIQDLQAHRKCTQLWPDYLSEGGIEKYLAVRFPDHEFPAKLKGLIQRNTAGNPLFVTALIDELLRDQSIENANGRWRLRQKSEQLSDWKSATIRQLIEGQLSRLPSNEQRLLEAAAVLGTEFSTELVSAALELDSIEIEERCEALARRQQIVRRAAEASSVRTTDQLRYEFVHDLYRAGAFDRVSQGRHRQWYRRIAEKMVMDSAGRIGEMATELAYYFEHASMPLEAARHCALAGERAARRSADSEALAQFRRGIELLKGVPESNERDVAELRLQVGLAPILVHRHGYETDDAATAVARASELNAKLGEGDQTFAALRGLYMILVGKPDYHAALDLCDRMDRVAQNDPDPYVAAEALRLRGFAAMGLGRLVHARDALNRAILVSTDSERSLRPTAFSEDIRATSMSVLGLIHWLLGYPDQSTRLAQQAVDRAVKLAGPFTIAYARRFRATIKRWQRNSAAVIEDAEATIATCEQYGFQVWRMQASLDKGWAIAMQGQGAAAIREIRAALPLAPFTRSGAATILADVCLLLGKTNEGLRAVDDALELAREHQEEPWQPELYRLKGELLLHRAERRKSKRVADLEQAERCFLTAIERARAMEAKSLELRSAMSLCRFANRSGKGAEARRILAGVYDWFSEGFDTLDLVDARRLLAERHV